MLNFKGGSRLTEYLSQKPLPLRRDEAKVLTKSANFVKLISLDFRGINVLTVAVYTPQNRKVKPLLLIPSRSEL